MDKYVQGELYLDESGQIERNRTQSDPVSKPKKANKFHPEHAYVPGSSTCSVSAALFDFLLRLMTIESQKLSELNSEDADRDE